MLPGFSSLNSLNSVITHHLSTFGFQKNLDFNTRVFLFSYLIFFDLPYSFHKPSFPPLIILSTNISFHFLIIFSPGIRSGWECNNSQSHYHGSSLNLLKERIQLVLLFLKIIFFIYIYTYLGGLSDYVHINPTH